MDLVGNLYRISSGKRIL